MLIKLSNLKQISDLYPKIKDQILPLKLSYKLSKLIKNNKLFVKGYLNS